ncbi:SRPBCC domain-containing protein [Arthrobacter sp. ZGTC412]|uniref:SRPBCC domain-containing protein n=1 Tax=Arthrobacter sp. ZGTC412 TaxID=2058900 RepID=UPI002157957A|nr:SRPBCC domain-containing protein [Arthrobacter sp. ZGTC412]
MPGDYVATSSVTIDAPHGRVWDIITDPAATKEFMFGAELVTDWTVGGPITWSGTWDGKDYQDKGVVLGGGGALTRHVGPVGGGRQEDCGTRLNRSTG